MEPLPDATPQPDGQFVPQLDNAAREAERVLDEISASHPENLASRVAALRESAREVEQRRARASEGGETAVSEYIEWAAEKGRLIVMDAKSDNFILTAEGVVPIDLQIGVIASLEFIDLDIA